MGGGGEAMIFKGYVWGGSLHGQILEHSRPDYVVKSCGGGNEVAAYRKPPDPYPKWKRVICRWIGVPEWPAVPEVMLEIHEEHYRAKFLGFGPRRMCIWVAQHCKEPTEQDFRNLYHQYPELVQLDDSWGFTPGAEGVESRAFGGSI